MKKRVENSSKIIENKKLVTEHGEQTAKQYQSGKIL